MQFLKYHKFGAYHWRWYKGQNSKYMRHVNHVKEWVEEKNAIDIGAGDGLIVHVLGIRGIDNEPKAVEVAQKMGVTIDLGDAYQLPYVDSEFEAAYMGDVLEHIEFPQKALQEAKRVIQKYLYVAAPLRKRHCRVVEEGHYREYLPKELQKEVEQAGFTTEDIHCLDNTIYGKFKKPSL